MTTEPTNQDPSTSQQPAVPIVPGYLAWPDDVTPPPAPPAAPAVTPAAAAPPRKAPTTAWLLVVAGVGGLVGSTALPWATVSAPFIGTVNVSGMHGDGIITAAAGGLLGLLGIACLGGDWRPQGGIKVIGLLGALAMLAVGIVDITNVGRLANAPEADIAMVQTGSGLWLVVIAGVLGVLATITMLQERPAPAHQ